jgi:8-oxo-dGTP pyrophosphatase MutT (NUDIX family)
LRKQVLLETPRFTVCAEERKIGNEKIVHYYVEKPDAVLVIPHTDHEVALLSVMRPLVGRSIELPGGRIEAGERPLQAARRELTEECSLKSANWRRITTSFPLPSVATEKVYVYAARVQLVKSWRLRVKFPGEGIEQIIICTFPMARRYALNGSMRCAVDAYSLLVFLEWRGRGKGEKRA